MLLALRHRDNFPHAEILVLDLTAYDLLGSQDDFINSIPTADRPFVAARLLEDRRLFFTAFRVIGFSPDALAAYQSITTGTMTRLAKMELPILRQINGDTGTNNLI
jgi:hypothetical protein